VDFIKNNRKNNPNGLDEQTIKKLKKLGRDYQLFFFFRGDCAQSRSLAATVNQFSQIYGWTVWAITSEKEGLPEYPTPHTDHSLIEKLNLKILPSLIAMHCHSQFYVPLSYGQATLDDIEGELEILLTHEEGRHA